MRPSARAAELSCIPPSKKPTGAFRVHSPLRHVILLTDGLTDAADFKGLLARMERHHITVSTVAVGDDADTELLANIARWGRGRTYATSDARDVPPVFLTDTTLASRGLMVEKSFFPRELSAAEMIRGLSLRRYAQPGRLRAHVRETGRRAGSLPHVRRRSSASWRYGLGRTAAFTSDFGGRWSGSWLTWSQFPRFAAQMVRWIERPSDSGVLHARIGTGGGAARVAVDAFDSLGAFRNDLSIDGIYHPSPAAAGGAARPASGPGMYEAAFPRGDR